VAPWPERPPGARWTRLSRPTAFGWYGFWGVFGLPPEPWPRPPAGGEWDRPTFGPPGTVWGPFSGSSVLQREGLVGESVPAKLLYLLRKLGVRTVDGSGSWTVPEVFAYPAVPVNEEDLPVPMHFVRTAIVGAIGTDEQLVHVLNWRHSTTENAPMDRAAVAAFGGVVRDKWQAFLNATTTGSGTVKSLLGTQLTYTEVRSAYLVQPEEGAAPDWVVPTQVAAFNQATSKGTSPSQPLPYEVALALTHNTNFRGPRFRGRIYLGVLSKDLVGTDGQFLSPTVQQIAAAYGTAFVAGVAEATDYELHVCSLKYATSAPVIGVKAGHVPDSQRRRRKNRPENFVQAWGSPVGSLV
jgi:hypothetical protein